jgi:EmrB/QacA subfamily drug resistance transporter
MSPDDTETQEGAMDEPSRRQLFLRVFPPIMLPVFLAVVDQTIVATALPAMAATFGDVERISWVVISYLVANTIAAPVYGRLGDLFGRRLLMLISLCIFIVASVLCALSGSITALTLARVLQGLGGGGLMTLSQALIGESVPLRERGRFQGYLAGVIVCSSTFGPVAGGFLTQLFGWQSVFLVNLPLGILAFALVLRLPAHPRRGNRLHLDMPGLVLLSVFVTTLLLALERLQRFDRAAVPAIAGLMLVSLAALALLIRQERRAREPLLPIRLLGQAAIWRADAMAALSGASLAAMVTFLPIYLQVVAHASPGETGFIMLPLTAGVGIGSVLTGRYISRTGLTAIVPSLGLMFTACTLIAAGLLAPRLTSWELAWLIAAGGICQGSAMPVAQLTVQHLSGSTMLGAGAASVQLSRSLGSALGVAVVGAVLFLVLSSSDNHTAALFADMVEQGPKAMAGLSAAQQAAVQAQIAAAFSAAFFTIAGFSCALSAAAWSLPMRRL